MIKKLFRYVGEYKKYAILTPLAMVGEVIMDVLIPFVMALIIDNGILGDGGIGYTVKMGGVMIVMALCSLLFGTLAGTFAARAGMGFAKNLRTALFAKVQDFSFKNADKFSTASLVTRLTTDVTHTQNMFMMILRMAVRSPLMFIGAIIMAFTINGGLASSFLFVIPVLGVAIAIISTKAFPRFKAMLTCYDKMNGSVQENLTAMRVVKAYVREDHERDKFEKNADDTRRAQVYAEKLLVMTGPIMQISMFGCVVAILYFGGNLVIGGTMAIGELSSFINYITQILMSLMMISMIFVNIVLSRASMQRIIEVLDEVPDINDSDAQMSLVPANGAIEFDDVSFGYVGEDGPLTLTNVNLSIKSGETVGIIGGTGSAKTTLVQLIPRLYDVTSGSIKVGGRDVREYSLDHLRGSVAMVLQKNVLFSGTIRDNIRWGKTDASDQEVEAACRAAQADDFIRSFPMGYDTVLGQGGVNVSGGQKQRLCIARALISSPRILILDDSTSAVDTATDANIRAALREHLNDTTKIVIAQRITSVMDADRVIVLDNGQIADCGTHDELMERSDIYREVYTSQVKEVA